MRNAQGILHKATCLLAVALLGFVAAPSPAQETPACDSKSFKGAFGYKLSGFVYDGQGYMYVLGAVGRMVSDGEGNLTGTETYSFDGTIVKRQYTGTYTINPECTGTLTLDISSTNAMQADLVIVNNGLEVELMQTDAGFVMTGSLKHQTPPIPTAALTRGVPIGSQRR